MVAGKQNAKIFFFFSYWIKFLKYSLDIKKIFALHNKHTHTFLKLYTDLWKYLKNALDRDSTPLHTCGSNDLKNLTDLNSYIHTHI